MGKSEAGVKVFSIGGRMVARRQRCLGMTNEERQWRAQFLKDQVLTAREPVDVPEYYKETHNFLRRLYKTPLYKFQKALEPTLGRDGAYLLRHVFGKFIMTLGLIYWGVYYIKYHANDFQGYRSLEYFVTRPPMDPNDPNYPNYPVKKPSDYYDMGFYSSVLCREVKKVEPPPSSAPPPPPPSRLPPQIEPDEICEINTEEK